MNCSYLKISLIEAIFSDGIEDFDWSLVKNNLPKPLKAFFYVLEYAFGIKVQRNQRTS